LIHGGDLNQNIYGWSEYFKDRNQAPYTFDYNLKELHSLLEGGVDLAYNFSHRWSAALSLEYKIRSGIHLIVEAAGRMVEFKEWKGNQNDSFSWDHTWGYWGAYSDKDSLKEAAEGKLWMVIFHSEETGKSYPRFIFSDEKPSSSFYTEVRPARINLNGLSLRAGIKISF